MKASSPVKVALALGTAGTAYFTLVRPWFSKWGATGEEVARSMPLDDRIPDPTAVTTRAITIHAPAEQIWHWIVQMGEPPRAGYYSYTWIERMQGLKVENVDRILPEAQTLKVGDALDKAGNMRVIDIDPGRYVVLGPPDIYDWLKSTWVIALYPVDRSSTRLVTRLRARMSFFKMLRAIPPLAWPFWIFIDPGVFMMERKMMTEIERHAEGSTPKLRIEGEIVINRPVEEVFDFVSDERNEPLYNPRMLRAEQISSGPIGAGTRFRAEVASMGRTSEMTIEFTTYERPRRLSSTTRMSAMDFRGTLTFHSVPEGTRMQWSWDVEPRGVFKLMTPLIARIGRHQEEDNWAGLKRYLEAQKSSLPLQPEDGRRGSM